MKKLVLLVFLVCSVMGFGMENYDFGKKDFGDRIFTFRLEIDGEIATLFGKGIPKPKEIGLKEMDMRYRGEFKKGQFICSEVYRGVNGEKHWDKMEEQMVYDIVSKKDGILKLHRKGGEGLFVGKKILNK